MVTVTDTARGWLPTHADLDAATARTAAALADPAASRADVERLAALEEIVHLAYLQQPGADAELQAEAELEAAV
jgi:hypothetical protein